MSKPRIVTHPGKAHRDDFLSCCLLLLHLYNEAGPATIERRSVVGEDLACQNTWVVDTGRQYQPHFRNFDHHQETPEVFGKCALDLVCDYLFTKEEMELARDTFPWLHLSSVHDCNGPAAAAKVLGVTLFQYSMCGSPLEKWVLETFSCQTSIEVTSATYTMMLNIGRCFHSTIKRLKKQKDDIAKIPPPVDMEEGIRYWDVRGGYCDGTTESQMLLNHRAAELGVNVIVNHSTRSDGPSIYILPQSLSIINSKQIKDDPSVYFSHANGHFAIFNEDTTGDQLRNLLIRCKVPSAKNNSHKTPVTRPRGRSNKKKKTK